jgi:hypothetical protein
MQAGDCEGGTMIARLSRLRARVAWWLAERVIGPEPWRCRGCLRVDTDGAPDADGAWVCRECWEEEALIHGQG